MQNVLPDSRLHDRLHGSVMADWTLTDGSTVRIEMAAVYCASCGVPFGWVPAENTAFAFWLCNQCFEQYGAVVGTCVMPDEEFCRNVQHEMQAKHGRDLSELELFRLIEQGKLGKELELLARESPYKVANR